MSIFVNFVKKHKTLLVLNVLPRAPLCPCFDLQQRQLYCSSRRVEAASYLCPLSIWQSSKRNMEFASIGAKLRIQWWKKTRRQRLVFWTSALPLTLRFCQRNVCPTCEIPQIWQPNLVFWLPNSPVAGAFKKLKSTLLLSRKHHVVLYSVVFVQSGSLGSRVAYFWGLRLAIVTFALISILK